MGSLDLYRPEHQHRLRLGPRTKENVVPQFRRIISFSGRDQPIASPGDTDAASNNATAAGQASANFCCYCSPPLQPVPTRKWTLETVSVQVLTGRAPGDAQAVWWDPALTNCGMTVQVGKNDKPPFTSAVGPFGPTGALPTNFSTFIYPLVNPIVTQDVKPNLAFTLNPANTPANPLACTIPLPQPLNLDTGDQICVANFVRPRDDNAPGPGDVYFLTMRVTMQILDAPIEAYQ